MAYRNFLLVLHIGGAIMLMGTSFTYPLIGMIGKKEGSDPKTLLRLGNAIAHKLLVPADYLMPLSGALLILQSKGGWDPFIKQNRWLLGAIILFTALFVIANFIQVPVMKKALAMAERGEYGPEFGSLMGKMEKFGPVLGILTVIIILLMILKPGSGAIHF